MNKRLAAVWLCALLALALFAACGENDAAGKPSAGGSQTADGTRPNGTQTPGEKLAEGAEDIWDGLGDVLSGDKMMKDTGEGFRAYNIDGALLDDYVLYRGSGENDPHEIFVARVRDGQLSRVEQALEARRAALAQQWSSSSEPEMAYAHQPVVYKNGRYVMLAVHEKADELKSEFERLTKG